MLRVGVQEATLPRSGPARGRAVVESRWLILLLLFLARTAMGFQFQTVGSTAPALINAFGIDYTALGTLIGLYLLPGILIALPSGFLGQKFNAKPIVLAGFLLMALGGCILGASSSYTGAVVGRLVSGTGAVMMNIMLTRMVADWFSGREISTAMSILVASWPLGLALGLLSFDWLSGALGWRVVMHLGAFTCCMAFIAVALVYRDPQSVRALPRPPASFCLRRIEWIQVSLAGFVWGALNVGYIVLVSFLPGLFAESGYTPSQASGFVSLLGWALIGLLPIGGYVGDRVTRPHLFMATTFVLVAVAAAALPFTASPLLAFAVLVIAVGLPAGAVMAMPSVVLSPHARALGMGVYYTWFYLMMAAFPALAGTARDLTHSAAAPVLFAAAMMMAAALGVAAFRIAGALSLESR